MLRRNVGRLLIVAVGGGCLAALIFVALPMLNEPPPQGTQDEIVAEIPGTDERQVDEGRLEPVTAAPSALVGMRNDGEEVAVIFPAAEPGAEGALAAVEEAAGEASGLPQVLSAQDVADARAALEVQEPEPVVAVEPDSAGESEEDVVADIAPLVPPAAVEARATGPIVLPVAETGAAVDAGRAVRDMAARRRNAESEAMVAAKALAVDRVAADGDGRPANVERPAVRRIEFDMPVSLDPRALREVSHPSGGVPELAASEAQRAGVIVPGTLRGVMGYRLPLISRQEVPDQIVSGVLIPAHTTFVILKEGSWELVDLTAKEVQALREHKARKQMEAAAERDAEEVEKPWTLLRALRRVRAPAHE